MKTYSPRYDVWLLTVLVAALFLGLIISFELLQASILLGGLCFTAIVLTALVFLMYGIPCEYYLDDEHLRIRAGLGFRSIAYIDIQAAEKAGIVLPKPAWSLQRVDIVVASGIVQISPKDRDGFLRDINQRLALAKGQESPE